MNWYAFGTTAFLIAAAGIGLMALMWGVASIDRRFGLGWAMCFGIAVLSVVGGVAFGVSGTPQNSTSAQTVASIRPNDPTK